MTAGTIECKAAVLWEANTPFKIETILVDPPKASEVRVKILHSGLCHSDYVCYSGKLNSYTQFPIILGHEGTGIVESVGQSVTEVAPGDQVLLLWIPQCRRCRDCKNDPPIRCKVDAVFKMKGVMTDGTSRVSVVDTDGSRRIVHQFMSTSTFAEYTVVDEMHICKIQKTADLRTTSLLGCGVSTGYGAVLNTAQVKPGSSCVIFGLGTVGLAAVIACKYQGAAKIIGVDINDEKAELAKQFGATEFVNPTKIDTSIVEYLKVACSGTWPNHGPDYTFTCIGNVTVMRQAFESSNDHGTNIVIGVAADDGVNPATIDGLNPMAFLQGRTLKGCFFGDWMPKDSIPKLLDSHVGHMRLDKFITNEWNLDQINEAFECLHMGQGVKGIINF